MIPNASNIWYNMNLLDNVTEAYMLAERIRVPTEPDEQT
jgi:hypothetical protein